AAPADCTTDYRAVGWHRQGVHNEKSLWSGGPVVARRRGCLSTPSVQPASQFLLAFYRRYAHPAVNWTVEVRPSGRGSGRPLRDTSWVPRPCYSGPSTVPSSRMGNPDRMPPPCLNRPNRVDLW